MRKRGGTIRAIGARADTNMDTQWCWRCKANVQMLNEDEWSKVYPHFVATISAQKLQDATAYWSRLNSLCAALESCGLEAAKPFVTFEHQHRLSHFGRPCPKCGKVL